MDIHVTSYILAYSGPVQQCNARIFVICDNDSDCYLLSF